MNFDAGKLTRHPNLICWFDKNIWLVILQWFEEFPIDYFELFVWIWIERIWKQNHCHAIYIIFKILFFWRQLNTHPPLALSIYLSVWSSADVYLFIFFLISNGTCVPPIMRLWFENLEIINERQSASVWKGREIMYKGVVIVWENDVGQLLAVNHQLFPACQKLCEKKEYKWIRISLLGDWQFAREIWLTCLFVSFFFCFSLLKTPLSLVVFECFL
jgi:hypothetical protein